MKTFIYTTAGQSSGREFVLLDDENKEAQRGNTASTSIDFRADVAIEVKSVRQLNQIYKDILDSGYWGEA